MRSLQYFCESSDHDICNDNVHEVSLDHHTCDDNVRELSLILFSLTLLLLKRKQYSFIKFFIKIFTPLLKLQSYSGA